MAFLQPLATFAYRLLPTVRREGRAIALVGVGIVLFIAAFTGLILREIDETSRASQQEHAEQVAQAVSRQFGTTLFMVEKVLRQARDEILLHDDPGRLSEHRAQSEVAHGLLKDFFFVNAQGVIRSATAGEEALTQLDVSDRDYFRSHLEGSIFDNHVGAPIRGRLTGVELMPVSTAVRRARGELAGVVVAMLDMRTLDRIWKEMGLRPGDTIELIGEDNVTWLVWPPRAAAGGAAGDPLVWSRRIPGWPMRIAVEVDRAAVDPDSLRAKGVITGAAAAGSLMVLLFCLLLANRARQTTRERDADQAAQAHMLAAINAVPVEFVEYDRDRRLLVANQAARNASPWRVPGTASGRTIDEVMAAYATHFKTAQTAEAWTAWTVQTIADFDRGGVSDSCRPDGQWRRSYVSDMPGGGRVVVRVDITELKRREAQLAAERDAGEAMRARMAAAMDAIPVEFFEYDRERRLILANRAARRSQMWIGEPIGKTHRELLEEGSRAFRAQDPGRDWDAWTATRIADIERGGTFEFSRPDGTCGRFYINEMPGGGRVVVRVDITEAKRRENEVAVEMERLNSVFQSTGAGILMLDRDARVVMINQFLLDLLGVAADAVVGRPYAGLSVGGLDPADIERWQAASGAQRLKAVVFERNLAGADGAKHIIRITANPIQDETGRLRYIVLIGVDDTERRMGEIRLFDSSRLATLGEMATGMAHEINQPLAVIRMAADSLLEELDMPEAAALPADLAALVRSKLARISGQTERASGLVQKLRVVARKPANDSLPFDVGQAARSSDDLLREQLRVARIDLKLDLPPPGLMARGETSRLQQVIINLVLNARDAVLDSSKRPMAGPLGHIVVRLTASTRDGGAVLVVEDDGPGIPDHVLPRLFEPFFTTKPTGQGTGLGLSISYDIIKRMGGEITAENRPEGGARFTAHLPPAALPAAISHLA